MTNMEIYEQGRAVPQEAQKKFDNGKFAGTDINPMWRIKKMTELFGPCGIGWYYEVLSERAEEHDNTTIAVVDLNLYVKVNGEWSKPIYGTGGNVIRRFIKKTQQYDVSDEGYKMALTDALSVACKALGIGADIYFEKDKTKYTMPREQETLVGEKVYHCEECGMQLGPVNKNGKVISVEDQLRVMTSYTNKIVCPGCLKKIVEAAKAEAAKKEA